MYIVVCTMGFIMIYVEFFYERYPENWNEYKILEEFGAKEIRFL